MSIPLLYLCPLSERHQRWRVEAGPPEFNVIMRGELTRSELLQLLPEVEFLITERRQVLDGELIRAGRQLRLIQRIGTFTHDIDLEAAREASVPVAIWPMTGAIYVAEHLMMQILALLRRAVPQHNLLCSAPSWPQPSRKTDENTFAFNWSGQAGVQVLYGATVGIWGLGEIGAELARRLRGWNCRVLYHKRNRLPSSVEAELGIEYVVAEDGRVPWPLLAESDAVVSLLPYTAQTVHLIDAEVLASMRPSAVLAHAGSGGVIDEGALARALRTGRIAGAALDTYEYEPLPAESPLLKLSPSINLLLTPHTAAAGPMTTERKFAEFYTNPTRVLRGEPLLHRVA